MTELATIQTNNKKFTNLTDISNEYQLFKYQFGDDFITKYNNIEHIVLDIFNNDYNDEDYKKFDLSNPSVLHIIGLYNQLYVLQKYQENKNCCWYYLYVYDTHFYYTGKYNIATIKYYKLACDLGSIDSINNLAIYYEHTSKCFDKNNGYLVFLASKYYAMKIKLDNADLNDNFANYCYCMYEKQKNDYASMVKYLLMAVDLNNEKAMHNLAIYYGSINNYEQMVKYDLMAIKLNYKPSIEHLQKIMYDTELYNILYNVEDKNDLIVKYMRILQKDTNVKCYIKKDKHKIPLKKINTKF